MGEGFDAVEYVVTWGLEQRTLGQIDSIGVDRFHIVAKMSKALDAVRAEEARRIKREGRDPVLKKSRSLLFKRSDHLGDEQHFRLRDLLRYNLKTVPFTFSRKPFNSSGITTRPTGLASSSMSGAAKPCAPGSAR